MRNEHLLRVGVRTAVLLVSVGCCITAQAQTASALRTAPADWRVYIGGTPFVSSVHGTTRILNGTDGSTGGIVIEGGVRLNDRFALGIELFPRSSVSTVAAGARLVHYTMVQNERVLGVGVRVRLLEPRPAGIDVVVGPALTFGDGSMSASTVSGTIDSVKNQSVGLLAGVDIPVRLTRHLALAPRVRLLASDHLWYDGYVHESRWGNELMAGFGFRVLF